MIDEIILEIKDKMKNGKWSFISDLVKFLMSLVRWLLHFINGTLVPLNVGGNYSYNLELLSSFVFCMTKGQSKTNRQLYVWALSPCSDIRVEPQHDVQSTMMGSKKEAQRI